MKDIDYIYKVQKEVFTLSGINALLHWDERTNMPKKGIYNRASQVEMLSMLVHQKLVSNKLYSTLNKLSKTKLNSKDSLVVKEMLKQLKKQRKIPDSFVKEMSRTISLASAAWEKARIKNDFTIFAPHLKKVVDLKRKQASLIDKKKVPYDILLEDYEEGMTCQKLDEIFLTLKTDIVDILKKIKETSTYKKQKKLIIKADKNALEKINKNIIKKMGIDQDAFSMTVSAHPFTTKIGSDDVRITTRYIDPMESFFATIHETGHALYEQGMPEKYHNTVIGSAASIGLHESQSRFWENMIAKNKDFWKGYSKNFTPYVRSKKDLYKKMNQVSPDFIRVDADEVTYPLHIILRYEIEKDMINGNLQVKDAKKVWNKKFKEMFGITPKNDNQGILQDMHWSLGAIGYFPTYAIGTIYASQIYSKMSNDIEDFSKKIRNQDFSEILTWLRKNIHSKASTLYADEIIKKATGKGLTSKVFTNYLENKYLEIYKK